MKRPFETLVGPMFGLSFLLAVLATGACDSFELDWTPVEDSVTLYSLAEPDFIDQPGAFDFINRRRVVVEQPGGDPMIFDMAFSEVDGEFVFVPAGLFENFSITPGIAVDSSTSFDELARAPTGGYTTDAPVPVRSDVVYIIRTRQARGSCTRYGKFEVLELEAQGVIDFRQVRNNLCNDRELIPADSL